MINLLEETLDFFRYNSLKIKDIVYIGTDPAVSEEKYACTWEQFRELARSFNYDNGFGSQKVMSTLVIIFEDGSIMTRSEYDGSERWDFTKKRVLPTKRLPLTKTQLRE